MTIYFVIFNLIVNIIFFQDQLYSMNLKVIMLIIILFSVFTISCNDGLNQVIPDKKTGKPMLVGLTELSAFKDPNFSEWYSIEYKYYEADQFIIDQIKLIDDSIKIEIFMGTWCGDSRREVPRFNKILDLIDFDKKNLLIVNLDREKRSPGKFEKNKNIEYVPTIIFYKNNIEIGRIIEYPIVTLESDILEILILNQKY